MSDDSHVFCPSQLCITEFLLGYQSQIRIKSEVGTVKHVEALQFFFLLAKILSIVFKTLKIWCFSRTVVCVRACVRVCVCGGGSRRYDHSNIYHDDPAIGYSITCVDRPRCWRMGQWLQMHFTLTTRVGICVGNEHRR